MSDQQSAVLARQKQYETPPHAPLDPYVTALVQWIASTEEGIVSSTLSRRAAEACGWPQPFADAAIAAARGRRLLSEIGPTGNGGRRTILSVRGRNWLAAAEPLPPTQSENGREGVNHK
jgi:hypothetical protein